MFDKQSCPKELGGLSGGVNWESMCVPGKLCGGAVYWELWGWLAVFEWPTGRW